VLAIVPTDSPVRGASRPGLALIRRVHLERPDNCRRAAAAGLSLAQWGRRCTSRRLPGPI